MLQGEYREKVDLCEYRKIVQASTEKGRIRASIEKLSRRVPEKGRIWVSTEKW